MPELKVTPLGAGQDVGRSCILLSMGNKNIMLDCGMHMGYNDERRFPDFGYITPEGPLTPFIDCVIISHFHLDHCGALPYMSEMVGYNGPIYMTHPTKAIAPILLEDMRKVSVEKKGEQNFFTSQMIKDCMKKVVAVTLHQTVMVDNELEIKAYYAGHVLGAAMFCIKVGSQSVVYTGDYNMTPDRHLGAAWIDKCRPDLLISESTYATTIRDSKRCREKDFLKKVHECIERGGKVLIPVFALGRAQELCILLETYWERMNLKAPIYFALGLTEKANNYYKMFITWTNQKIRKTFVQRNMFDFKHIKPFDRQYIDNPGPMVVFATPGMLHAGLSLQIFKKWAPNENNMIIMPGFCVQGTVGHKILNGAKKVEFENRQVVEVKMSVEYMSFSAHADAKGIMQLIQYCEPKNVMLVHGEAEKIAFLKEKIQKEFNINCYNPANGETNIIHTPVKIPIDVSLPLLKSEAKKFSALPPNPKRRRILHGVLVMKDNNICLMDVEDACKEAGINRHVIRFTSTISVNDNGPSLSTAHKLHNLLKEKLSQWPVTFCEGEISVESVLVKVEGDDDDQKTVYVSWTNQDEDLGSYILSLINCIGTRLAFIVVNFIHEMVLPNTGKFRINRPPKKDEQHDNTPVYREESSEFRLRQVLENEEIDNKYGFGKLSENTKRTGFLLNMHASEILDEDKRLCSVVDYYFMEEDGTRFKTSYPYMPYFYILTKRDFIQEVSQFLSKRFSGTVGMIETVTKEDLDLPNHLIGLKQKYIKLSFYNQTDLVKVRRELLREVRKNKGRQSENAFYTELLASSLTSNLTESNSTKVNSDQMENIIDIREYDVPYHVRVSIDLKIFCGSWYTVYTKNSSADPPLITPRSDLIERPEPIVLAFDIETTKLPLKFPDSATDQIMMISYMIDGQGYLITNREILSADIEDFEYTPKPEFEGKFTIFNEKNEQALIQKFFDHIMDIRPHIFVTYNGDFFDWPFIEARAASYDLDMKKEIGFSRNREGVFCSRPAMHMDCLCWVKRDSYLPVGAQNLKAVAKAKLRYDPVELDPEEMCPLAVSDPQVLSNYSVSDAVATYYLYMQYVHPFIFALCTIIPCEPDEVLRKGSGTLCEALLMVEAFHANIIFPNKEETILNKLTHDGHVLQQETYVGGHVEALESGVFRADIPYRFRIVPDAVNMLISKIPETLKHAIEVEENIPIDTVVNLQDVAEEIKAKLVALKQQPMRLEKPLIYHLDVGAMYPNIILTNRLQPCAIVNETICAACDFNKPGAACQRNMTWTMREEYLPANRNEYQRIQQQLELEKFPSVLPGGPPRSYHQLSRQEQADLEKKRLQIYCRKVYKKMKITRVAERTTTICQKENSFYVDTVRAFRDRRYEYKALAKKAKQAVTEAIKGGDASEIKSAKNREVLYDSLQLAHKCILNSFYGYVMRRGARWFSMEMAGIVCYTGANIIMKARELIEQVGRPLELDTDGIWCILPASFPENFTIQTTHEKKKKFVISFPNTVLNAMVKEHFTNDQYHDLVDPVKLEYVQRSEISIFFEVDGPYKAMVLPASKEEGKKLKKRYAVFNFDGSLAELKGFEVKRRGELQLIKNFQSSVFEAFLKGDTLESCYASVAQVADYWLDVLYSHGRNMPDSELFDLISENRSMSKKLEEYGQQKSTSISTAKRLAEFLGDQMVKDAGLACKYVISKRPEGAPVTERAIPLAIFQAEDAVQKHFLRKWLKDSSISDIDIRDILDWDYYIERLGGTIQKIITIPAAMQGVPNPVPRVRHPDWLHKKILEKNDTYKQRRITDMFSLCSKSVENGERNSKTNAYDIEDVPGTSTSPRFIKPIANVNKRKRGSEKGNEFTEDELEKSWREVLGNPSPYGSTKESHQMWIQFQKRKWLFQYLQKNVGMQGKKKSAKGSLAVLRSSAPGSLGGFLQKTQRALLTVPWQIIQIAPTATAGEFKLWTLVQSELHLVKLTIPRIFYANLKKPKVVEQGDLFKKCNRTLPRSRPVYNLYLYSVPEQLFIENQREMYLDLSDPNVEGVYETKTSLQFRALISLGCVCKVAKGVTSLEKFDLSELDMVTLARQSYLSQDLLKHLYFYHHKHMTKPQQMFSLFLTPLKKALVIVLDTVRTNLMPNMVNLYNAERSLKKEKQSSAEELLPPEGIQFEVRVETDISQVYKILNKALQSYKDEKKGPTLLAVQSAIDLSALQKNVPLFFDFPHTQIHIQDIEELYNVIDWQKVGAKAIVRHYLNSEKVLELMTEQCRYFHIPIGNLPSDPAIFGCDLFFARHLLKANHVLWCSQLDKPDLGGVEETDARLIAENQEGSSEVCNVPGWYSSVCVELDIDSLAINTLLQSHHVTDVEGTSNATAFDANLATSIDDMISGNNQVTIYDESARCADAFKILKAMASGWMRDISLYRNVFADFQVVHFYRWLRSPKALLYEPALLRTLQTLMKKLFLQLVAEFKRLGCTIIYANFNRIVICTKKHNVEDALANVEFVVNSIRNKELYHSLEITYRQCWEHLVWLDPANYGGVLGKPNNEESPQEDEDDNDDDEEEIPTVAMNWNIAEQLPEAANCRNNFNAVIAGYINAIYSRLKHNMSRPNVAPVVLSQPAFGLGAYESVMEYAKDLLSGEISQTLFQMTERMNNRLQNSGDGTNPALTFVNSVCHILGLDSAMEEPVSNLKNNLLRLIGVGEYSESAIWHDPTVSYVIPQIICKACNHCRDVDLGRDQHRTDNAWFCPLCNTSYDNAEIQSQLLEIISKKFMAYNLQDLQCKKCSQVKMENLIRRCQCASEFKCLLSRKDLIKLLETLLKLAEKFSMSALAETVRKILELT
ncbi:DNA polymerase epsilon catalytic subunit 1 [Cylas formicarius]|uniref:DNA polymerase epsilon catalytic subunit 1 n=1 Tax=Cylas formicarius TaxID=197179 RepID=UPI002958669D|nr:DNA polymerase epsilon catalytic subunit 1 [Cylas formicarius]